MKINLYTVFVAEHLENTASSHASEDLACYGRSFTCRYEALKWVRDDMFEGVEEAWYDNADKTDDDIRAEAEKIYNEGDEVQWSWESCNRQYIWKLVEQEIELGDMSDEDTVTRLLRSGALDDDKDETKRKE